MIPHEKDLDSFTRPYDPSTGLIDYGRPSIPRELQDHLKDYPTTMLDVMVEKGLKKGPKVHKYMQNSFVNVDVEVFDGSGKMNRPAILVFSIPQNYPILCNRKILFGTDWNLIIQKTRKEIKNTRGPWKHFKVQYAWYPNTTSLLADTSSVLILHMAIHVSA